MGRKWLTDIIQRVAGDGEVSNWKSVLTGVLQGSVLGPLLFLIYIKDLENNIKSSVLTFPDDTTVFKRLNIMEINNIYKTRQISKMV